MHDLDRLIQQLDQLAAAARTAAGPDAEEHAPSAAAARILEGCRALEATRDPSRGACVARGLAWVEDQVLAGVLSQGDQAWLARELAAILRPARVADEPVIRLAAWLLEAAPAPGPPPATP
jgi:hypothetical protein